MEGKIGGEPHGYTEFFDSVDALVIGRNTYETVLAFETWPYGTKPVFVLSTRPVFNMPMWMAESPFSDHPCASSHRHGHPAIWCRHS